MDRQSASIVLAVQSHVNAKDNDALTQTGFAAGAQYYTIGWRPHKIISGRSGPQELLLLSPNGRDSARLVSVTFARFGLEETQEPIGRIREIACTI